ncbi:MAG: hypothetical protein K8S27_09590 [Candidatus Omnitrophica bacterium]|nr:hypothetical protein [Candidatus Omnitrophota bacterium]
MKKLNPIAELSKKYSESPIIRSLCQLLPGWSSADTLLQHRADEIKKDRLLTFFDELAKGEIALKPELINSNDFLHCFFATARAALNSRRKDKIEMFARLLNDFISSNFLTNANEYEEFLSMLDELNHIHISILFIIFKEKNSAKGVVGTKIMDKIIKWDSNERKRQYETEGDYLVSGALEKLTSLKLIATTHTSSMKLVRHNVNVLSPYEFTPLGEKFVSLIFDDEKINI